MAASSHWWRNLLAPCILQDELLQFLEPFGALSQIPVNMQRLIFNQSLHISLTFTSDKLQIRKRLLANLFETASHFSFAVCNTSTLAADPSMETASPIGNPFHPPLNSDEKHSLQPTTCFLLAIPLFTHYAAIYIYTYVCMYAVKHHTKTLNSILYQSKLIASNSNSAVSDLGLQPTFDTQMLQQQIFRRKPGIPWWCHVHLPNQHVPAYLHPSC